MAAQDDYYMMLAIEQAKKGLYTTRPNPAVGCVIVKGSHIVGQGFHPKAGQPHAEVFALAEAGTQAKGATAYVTLEPCSHFGRTPPCAMALIKAGVTRVVVAGLDPNPQVAGRGVEILRHAGVEVAVGTSQAAAADLNKGFLKAMRTGLPYVRLKIATSLDGRTAMATGESKWITGTSAREDVQRLRALSGAIITGSQTVIDDNPSLNVRTQQLNVPLEDIVQSKVVILDRRKRLSNLHQDYKLLADSRSMLVHSDDLSGLLADLVANHQIYDVLIESGATLAGSFVDNDLVDELIVYQAPCILGQQGKPMFALDIDRLDRQKRFSCISTTQIGFDTRMVFIPTTKN